MLLSNIKKISTFKLGSTLLLFMLLAITLLPIHPILLDFSILISLMSSITLTIMIFFIEKAIDFTFFPNILLITTIFRLVLNLASTRIILSHGHEGIYSAGSIIKTAGSLFMQGNLFIGIVFCIVITLINILVITKGANRMAEVAARFALDSMPGRQMAVEADLAAGVINENQAKEKRDSLQKESVFYGAMDGASKFVRGDAIASLIIVFINIIGGTFVGTIQRKMEILDALNMYTILTVGDSLIAQVPSILTSFSAAMLISRISSVSSEQSINNQILSYANALRMSSFVMLLISLCLPWTAMFICMFLCVCAFYISEEKMTPPLYKKSSNIVKHEKTQDIFSLLKGHVISLELSYELSHLIDSNKTSNIKEKILFLKEDITKKLGILLPQINVTTCAGIKSSSYNIKIKDIQTASYTVLLGKYMAIGGDLSKITGEPCKDPVWKIDGKWIDPEYEIYAEENGCTVINIPSIICAHLQYCIKSNIAEILNFSAVKKIISIQDETYKVLWDELVEKKKFSLSKLRRSLILLLEEDVSIKDFSSIIEAICEGSEITNDPKKLVEFIRISMCRQVCAPYVVNEEIKAIYVHSSLLINEINEKKICEKISKVCEGNNYVVISPHYYRLLLKDILRANLLHNPVISDKGIDKGVKIIKVTEINNLN